MKTSLLYLSSDTYECEVDVDYTIDPGTPGSWEEGPTADVCIINSITDTRGNKMDMKEIPEAEMKRIVEECFEDSEKQDEELKEADALRYV
jgi:hypothetical protein